MKGVTLQMILKMYMMGIENFESTVSYNVESNNETMYQYNRMILSFSRKNKDNLAEVKAMSVESQDQINQLVIATLKTVST